MLQETDDPKVLEVEFENIDTKSGAVNAECKMIEIDNEPKVTITSNIDPYYRQACDKLNLNFNRIRRPYDAPDLSYENLKKAIKREVLAQEAVLDNYERTPAQTELVPRNQLMMSTSDDSLITFGDLVPIPNPTRFDVGTQTVLMGTKY